MFKKIIAIFDSRYFQIFFALWTGLYLVQIIKKEQGAPGADEIHWLIIGFAIAIFFV